jgi:hypothetical protein
MTHEAAVVGTGYVDAGWRWPISSQQMDDAENANGNGSEWKATEDDEGGWPRTVGIAEFSHNHGRFGLSVRPLVSTSILGTMRIYRWYNSILCTSIVIARWNHMVI